MSEYLRRGFYYRIKEKQHFDTTIFENKIGRWNNGKYFICRPNEIAIVWNNIEIIIAKIVSKGYVEKNSWDGEHVAYNVSFVTKRYNLKDINWIFKDRCDLWRMIKDGKEESEEVQTQLKGIERQLHELDKKVAEKTREKQSTLQNYYRPVGLPQKRRMVTTPLKRTAKH